MRHGIVSDYIVLIQFIIIIMNFGLFFFRNINIWTIACSYCALRMDETKKKVVFHIFSAFFQFHHIMNCFRSFFIQFRFKKHSSEILFTIH